MLKKRVADKLDEVLCRLGMNTISWSNVISGFCNKIELLSTKSNYNKLLKSLFSSNDLHEFNSYVFESLFAYDFESREHPLLYEVKQMEFGNSSIDFCYELSVSKKIYFELRNIQQKKFITDFIEHQLSNTNQYEILLDGADEKLETIRLQNLILSKCQKDDGEPIKFGHVNANNLNFIVVNISELHLGGIDDADCVLTLYGDRCMNPFYRRGIFGMWQKLNDKPTVEEKEYSVRFQHFRNTIHGVMFTRYMKGSGMMSKMYFDRELEYFPILNTNLLDKETCISIYIQLGSFLHKWKTAND